MALAMAAGLFLAANVYVIGSSHERIYTVEKVPARHVALVLGTSPWVAGRKNLYFEYRMDTAAALYQSGKARYLLLSGDHGRQDYDEPGYMKSALMARGVPEPVLILDHAGFRTLDSIARAKAVFGQSRVIIVSQEFHNHRALFLARHHGLDALAVNAHAIDRWYGVKTHLREWFARAAAVADTYVLGRQPRFYGPQVTIPTA